MGTAFFSGPVAPSSSIMNNLAKKNSKHHNNRYNLIKSMQARKLCFSNF